MAAWLYGCANDCGGISAAMPALLNECDECRRINFQYRSLLAPDVNSILPFNNNRCSGISGAKKANHRPLILGAVATAIIISGSLFQIQLE
jgi:hypothetical protein